MIYSFSAIRQRLENEIIISTFDVVLIFLPNIISLHSWHKLPSSKGVFCISDLCYFFSEKTWKWLMAFLTKVPRYLCNKWWWRQKENFSFNTNPSLHRRHQSLLSCWEKPYAVNKQMNLSQRGISFPTCAVGSSRTGLLSHCYTHGTLRPLN